MNRKGLILIATIVCLTGVLSWSTAQSSRAELFDAKKSQQELEIMRGILGTTLTIVSHELRGGTNKGVRVEPFANRGAANITAFYLYGQGATFMIATSAFRFYLAENTQDWSVQAQNWEIQTQRALSEVERLAAQQARSGIGQGIGAGRGKGAGQGIGAGTATPAPPAAPAPTAAPIPPIPPQPSSEELRKKLAEAQDEVKKRRDETEKQNQSFQEILAQSKVYLIEALADYGDSLKTVKPNEYVNILLTADPGGYMYTPETSSRTTRDVLSVQRSVITDYKAGRITLDTFKQKVLQYSE